jgi:phospholipase C
VPCFVVSPWSKGGYVNSQVFDHTSLIRFIEAVFGPRVSGGLSEPNITPWRAAVCGDLTTAFNFKRPNAKLVALPSTAAYVPPNGNRQTVGYIPVPPLVQALPTQEPGIRRARALPYAMHAFGIDDAESRTVTIDFATTGTQAVVFLVRSANPLDGQRSYTVEPSKSLTGSWSAPAGVYDLSVSGPNGFLRRFAGDMLLGGTGLTVQESYVTAPSSIVLTLSNTNAAALVVIITNAYTGDGKEVTIAAGTTIRSSFALNGTHGWYDLRVTLPAIPSFGVQLAGHVEDGDDSFTDPMIS